LGSSGTISYHSEFIKTIGLALSHQGRYERFIIAKGSNRKSTLAEWKYIQDY